MAKRVFTKMPIWGISVLAVGSIGAPLPSAGKADIGSNGNFAMLPSIDSPIVHPLKVNLSAGQSHSRLKKFTPSFQSSHIAPRTSVLQVGRQARIENADAPTPLISASALPLKTISDNIMSQPGQAKNNIAVIPPASAMADGRFQPIQPATNRSIYGTSANNAYKVYFPQIEPPALGNADEDLKSFNGAPDQDDRMLTKNGSYLFYEAPADVRAIKKIEAAVKSEGNLEAETVARAVAQFGKSPEEAKLTAPPLQKRPLVFGESLFQASESTQSETETPADRDDVETIETPKD